MPHDCLYRPKSKKKGYIFSDFGEIPKSTPWKLFSVVRRVSLGVGGTASSLVDGLFLASSPAKVKHYATSKHIPKRKMKFDKNWGGGTHFTKMSWIGAKKCKNRQTKKFAAQHATERFFLLLFFLFFFSQKLHCQGHFNRLFICTYHIYARTCLLNFQNVSGHIRYLVPSMSHPY